MIKTRKYIGIIILMFGTALVCTIFGSYYIDLSLIEIPNIPQTKMIYEAQLTMAKIICFLAGGCLGLVSLIVALFTVNRYINDNLSPMGILKAIGYSNSKISAMFLNVGLYVFGGSLLGYAGGMVIAPSVYTAMSENTGYILELSFHTTVPFILTIVLPVLFSFISFGFSYIQLRKPALSMIRKEIYAKINVKRLQKFRFNNNMSYLKELKKMTLSNHKIVLFFYWVCFIWI